MDFFKREINQHACDLGSLVLTSNSLNKFEDSFTNLALVVRIAKLHNWDKRDTSLQVLSVLVELRRNHQAWLHWHWLRRLHAHHRRSLVHHWLLETCIHAWHWRLSNSKRAWLRHAWLGHHSWIHSLHVSLAHVGSVATLKVSFVVWSVTLSDLLNQSRLNEIYELGDYCQNLWFSKNVRNIGI